MLVDIFYHTLQKAYRNGIIIEVTEEDIIKDGIPCCGYFDFIEKKLAISTAYSRQEVLQTFIHESCHMDQWFERSKILRMPLMNFLPGSVGKISVMNLIHTIQLS